MSDLKSKLKFYFQPAVSIGFPPLNKQYITPIHITHIISTIYDIAFKKAFNSNDNEILSFAQDEVAEWLRRWTANPLGSARVGSNPILVDDFD